MSTQKTMFGLPEHDYGEHDARWLWAARAYLKGVAASRPLRTATSDDVRAWCDRMKMHPTHPNVWGTLFKEPCWTSTGRQVPSTHPSNHGRLIQVWRLR